MEIHRIHPELLERHVRVLVVGCGGTAQRFASQKLCGFLPFAGQARVITRDLQRKPDSHHSIESTG